MTGPVFHLLAGPNGAGKSTLYRALVASSTLPASLEFINADLHERSHLQQIADPLQRSQAARQWADARRSAVMQTGRSFVSETVFSHPSKLQLIAQAQALGYQVVLYAVSVQDPKGLLARVAQRVREGGHAVPASRILARYPRTMANLKLAVRQADLAFVYDAAQTPLPGQKLLAICEKSRTTLVAEPLPLWAQTLLAAA